MRETTRVVLTATLSCLTVLAACTPEPEPTVPSRNSALPLAGESTASAVDTATSVPTIMTSAIAIHQATPSGTAMVPPAACPLGAGLREDTIEIHLSYQTPGRMYVTGSLGLAEEYFGQIETGLRVLVGPSLTRLHELAEEASESAVPYDVLAYSLEAGRHTPAAEQLDVVRATQQASVLAHENGKLLLMGPGWGLMEENRVEYAAMASYADLWIIQTQRLQSNPPGPVYREEVEDVITQLRRGNTNLRVWAQISATPGGRALSTEELLAYREAIVDLVDGVYVYVGGDPNRSETLEAIFATVCGGER